MVLLTKNFIDAFEFVFHYVVGLSFSLNTVYLCIAIIVYLLLLSLASIKPTRHISEKLLLSLV